MDQDPVRLVVKHTFLELECNEEAPAPRRDRRSSDAGVRYGRFNGDHQDERDLATEAAAEYAAEHPNSPMRVPAAARVDPYPLEPSSPMRLPSRKKASNPSDRDQLPFVSDFHDDDDPTEGWATKRSSVVSTLTDASDLGLYSYDPTAFRRIGNPAATVEAEESRVASGLPVTAMHGPPGQLSSPPGADRDGYSAVGEGPPIMHGPPGQHGYVPPCPPYPPFVNAGQMGYCDPWWSQQNQPYGATAAWPSVPYNMGQPPQSPLARLRGGMPAGDAAARGHTMAAASGSAYSPVHGKPGSAIQPLPPGSPMHAVRSGFSDVSSTAGAGGSSPHATSDFRGPSYSGQAGVQMSSASAPAGADTVAGTGRQTTVMLRNLPETYSRNMLVALLDRHGFRSKYDFVYMPMNFRTKASFGYAFVNFVSPIDAECCHTKFQGFTSWEVPSEKVCDVSWSNMHQGLAAHIERYRNSPVMHESVPDEYKPAVYAHGYRAVFPGPTKKLRIPRIRRPNADGDGDDALEDAA